MERRRARIEPDALPAQPAEDRHLRLPERLSHYVSEVLRMEPGDALELFDGDGRLLDCRIVRISDDGVRVAILEDCESRRNESELHLTLCSAIPKGKRWRMILEKTTELGVHRIGPLVTSRGVVEIPDDRREHKHDRWARIVGSAARQCERSLTPELSPQRPVSAPEWSEFDGLDFVVHARRNCDALATALREVRVPPGGVRLWVGPEGGFTDDEIEVLQERNARICHLGPRILRTETAAVVATTIAQQIAGDLDRRETTDSPPNERSAKESNR